MRPWLFQISPIVMPTDARRELHNLAINKTAAEYVDRIWEDRVAMAPAVRKSHRRVWPMKRTASNVIALKKAKRP